MELEIYLPKKLTTVDDLTDVIFDPIFYMDFLMLKWFDNSISEYFPHKNYTVKLFAGGKEFQPDIQKPPIFSIQHTGYRLSDEMHLGESQLKPHSMTLNHTADSSDSESAYATPMPVTAEYTIDAYMDLKRDVNKFNLWYMDQWHSIGLQYDNMPGIRIYDKQTQSYQPYKFYLKKGSSGFSTNWELEGTGVQDVIYTPSAGLQIEALFIRDWGAFPEAKTLIIKYFVTNFDSTNFKILDGETGEYLDATDTEHYKELLEQEDALE